MYPIISFLRVQFVRVLCILVAVVSPLAIAQPENYPNRAITLVVPFAAGGATDVTGRELARRLSTAVGQPVVVDNRPGASGIAAANYVLNSRPDGYTLLLNGSAKTVLKTMVPAVRYDPVKDFTSVSLFAKIPTVLVVSANKEIKDFDSLKTTLKASSDASWGSPGVGTAPHFAGATLMSALKSDAQHVAYKGSSPMQLDLLPGRILFAIDTYNAIKPHIDSGAVIPVAVIGQQRLKAIPNVPTLSELGFKQFSTVLYDGWSVVDVPNHTPVPIVERLNREISKILESREMIDKMNSLGMSMFGSNSPGDAQEFSIKSSRELSSIAAKVSPGSQ